MIMTETQRNRLYRKLYTEDGGDGPCLQACSCIYSVCLWLGFYESVFMSQCMHCFRTEMGSCACMFTVVVGESVWGGGC